MISGFAGIGEACAIQEKDERQFLLPGVALVEKPVGLRRAGGEEAVGYAVAVEELADLVRARRELFADDADQLHPGAIEPRPFREKFADVGIQMHLGGRPGLVEVIVELAQGAGLQDDGRGFVVAPRDEQRALGQGLDGAYLPEKIVAGQVGHPLVGDDQRDLLAV